jgi:hypothetical protein
LTSLASSNDTWLGAPAPKGFRNITDEVDTIQLDLTGSDSRFGEARCLFDSSDPWSLQPKRSKNVTVPKSKDFVVSDGDEQLLLFVPFRGIAKVFSIQLTSLSSPRKNGQKSKRPETIRLFINNTKIIDFEEAEKDPAGQEVKLGERDWDEKTGTAIVNTNFVKFQKVSTLTIFVVDGLTQELENGEQGEFTRLDRVRIFGRI